jgi:hypothetical protein
VGVHLLPVGKGIVKYPNATKYCPFGCCLGIADPKHTDCEARSKKIAEWEEKNKSDGVGYRSLWTTDEEQGRLDNEGRLSLRRLK